MRWSGVLFGVLLAMLLATLAHSCNRSRSVRYTRSYRYRANRRPRISCDYKSATFTAAYDDSSVYVYWPTPSVSDDRTGYTVNRIYGQGPYSYFRAGRHRITYKVTDTGGLTDTCSFYITIIVKTCKYRSSPSYGYQHCDHNDRRHGTLCSYSCYHGYHMSGSPTSSCGNYGLWLSSVPSCTRNSCGAPTIPPKGISINCTNGQYYESKCILNCDWTKGYWARHGSYISCLGNGTWNYNRWQCADIEKPKIFKCPEQVLRTTDTTYTWPTVWATDNSGIVNLTQTKGPRSGTELTEGSQLIQYRADDASGNIAPQCAFVVNYEVPPCTRPAVSSGGDYDPVFNCYSSNYTVGSSCRANCPHSLVLGNPYITCERRDSFIPASTWVGNDSSIPTCHKQACPDLTPPSNGSLACDKIFAGEVCQVQCHTGNDIPAHSGGHTNFKCGLNGDWMPVTQVPDCSLLVFPDANKLPFQLFYFGGNCSDNERRLGISERFLQTIEEAALLKCDDGECIVDNVDVKCAAIDEDAHFTKNDYEYEYEYEQEYEYEYENDDVLDLDLVEDSAESNDSGLVLNRRRRDVGGISSPPRIWKTTSAPDTDDGLGNSSGEGSGAVRVLKKRKPSSRIDVSFDWTFKNRSRLLYRENVTDFVGIVLNSTRLSLNGTREGNFRIASLGNLTVACGPGKVVANVSRSLCVPCPRGTFHNQEVDTCEACPVHTYSDTSGQTQCTPCGQMTGTKNNGSKTDRDCIAMCHPGHFSPSGLTPCDPCPFGTYQPKQNSHNCTPCSSDTTTLETGSSNLSHCVPFDVLVKGPVRLNFGPVLAQWAEELSIAFWFRTLPQRQKHSNISLVLSHPTRGHQMTFEMTQQTSIRMRGRHVPVTTHVPQDLWTHMAVVWKGYPSFVDIYRAGSRVAHYGKKSPLCFVPKDTELSIHVGEDTDFSLREIYVMPRSNVSGTIAHMARSCSPGDVGFDSLINKIKASDPSKISMVVPSVCSEIDWCSPSPCPEHHCRSFKYGFQCTCKGGFSGRTCEIPPDYCVVDNKCEHGAMCENIKGGVACTCTDDYKGRYCEIPIVHGKWSVWNPWSLCSVTCGGGKMSRSRYCDAPAPEPDFGKPCEGYAVETSTCNENKCPECKTSQLTLGKGVSVNCSRKSEAAMNCSVSCVGGLVFQEDPPVYTCYEETWVPGEKTLSCVEFKIPDNVAFNYTVPYKTRVGINMAADLAIIQNTASVCASRTSCVHNAACTVVVDVETCLREAGGCAQFPEGYNAKLRFEGIVVVSNVSAIVTRQNLAQAYSSLNASYNDLEKMYKECFLVTLTDGPVTPGTSIADSDITCPVGSVPDQGYCTTCAPGMYYNNGTCSQCERGWYQVDNGALECDTCPTAFNTKYTGSSFKSECIAPPADAFMLLTDPITGHIWSVTMSDFRLKPVSLPDNVRLASSGYDPVTNHIFYADKYRPAIHSVGPKKSTTYVTLNWAASVDGIAIDPISRLIFYTDKGNDVIGVVTMVTKYHKIVINSATYMPRHIEVDPIHGVMYWTDWGEGNKIERANYDGSGRKVLVSSIWPEGLTLDRDAGKLYWSDTESKTLQMIDLDKGNRTTLLTTGNYPSAIAVFNDFLFYSAMLPNISSVMMRVNVDGTGFTMTKLPPFSYLSDIHVFRKSAFKNVTNGCTNNNGGCSHLCFPRSNGSNVCACPDGYTLNANKVDCTKKIIKSWWLDVWMRHRGRRERRHQMRPRGRN
ncbi:uncharacterized protein LOC124112963 [Haliotis rufescens]|uniref:uncharacterized protein LOC124112963 n=1 Tax=Haliotis rufescens TaxID=6454 RepID=UPI00201F6840|nr:uncharacterized protein LOC124112963 [Haliotis rufescens]